MRSSEHYESQRPHFSLGKRFEHLEKCHMDTSRLLYIILLTGEGGQVRGLGRGAGEGGGGGGLGGEGGCIKD